MFGLFIMFDNPFFATQLMRNVTFLNATLKLAKTFIEQIFLSTQLSMNLRPYCRL